MKIVHGGAMAFTERRNPRGGTFHFKRLVEGASGTPGNFGLMLSRTYENFVSPRHRHNFEQLRVQIEGVCAFGRDGDMTPGTIGYFPEGAFYGPQSAEGPALVLVLQYGGPSGSGYMSEDDLQASVSALRQVGEFRDGVFHRARGEGRARQDAYEAAWENFNQRPMRYPDPHYPGPILTSDAQAPWQPAGAGISRRSFGSFKGGTDVSTLRLDPGATAELSGGSVMFVLSGEGVLATEAVAPQSSIHLDAGETAALSSAIGIEVLVMRLPQIAANEGLATQAA